MTSEQLISELNVLFEEVIDEGTVNLTPSTTAKEVEGWDSLNHIQIIAAIERKYGFRFTLVEIQSFKNVGEMVDSILSKI
ncbi:MAG: acyl carrier protein [Bacteroidia bacterium]|jgi:acyl carrier protein|nr:acyl carrier protein [Bacteroidia bacterium]MBP7261645.1 acyl carrier protein [Bacteroidia bacterium]MBP9180075.1 acyl carrier protein [Bacteroidia bacterium]MBP9725354.1 acyl carrier protein [Bacteroidia bacterium]